MRAFANLMILFSALLLGACMPMYKPTALSKTTKLDIKTLMSPQICVDGKWYRLQKDENGITRIPYGKPLTISNSYSVSEQMGSIILTESCKSATRFTPQKDASYYANFRLVEKRCQLNIFRKSLTNRLGLITVPTTRGSCVAK